MSNTNQIDEKSAILKEALAKMMNPQEHNFCDNTNEIINSDSTISPEIKKILILIMQNVLMSKKQISKLENPGLG